MVNLWMVPSFLRLETLRLTAASERPTLAAISTKERLESARRMSRILSSTLSRGLQLLGRDDGVEDLDDAPDLLLRHHERRQ